ncbi:DUF177 domain-containing protein [uncultured Clostridium sp.]|jgi:uncharacterized protein|uniref:YceD family protein n=1 Tax=uncultured Clostridium sp. TaxID=59620 RepID=UPI002607FE2F|nr:DUF177 domain-containing protein [uncultured Clostridium sp.]
MELKFSDESQKKEISKAIDLVVKKDTIILPGEDVKVLQAIEFNGKAKIVEDVIALEGSIKTKLELECSRCLGSFCIDVDTDIQEKFSNNVKEDESIAFIEGDILDVSEAIVSNVISTLPIKRICDEQCKGLCQGCGTDLNLHKCHCDNPNLDIRFDKLKELFKQ